MFRVVCKPQIIKLTEQENRNLSLVDGYSFNNEVWGRLDLCKKTAISRCKFKVGETIFVKEKFSLHRHRFFEGVRYQDEWYWADGNPEFGSWEKPRPATHMKQEHSRLFPRIKSVKVERLQDISEEDAIAEGFEPDFDWPWPCGDKYITKTSKNKFIEDWNATHKKPEEKFEANPFVFCYSYEVVRC